MPVFFAYYIGAPQISFFSYYIGAPGSLSSLTIWGPPQISFFSYNMGAPLRSISLLTICPPLRLVSLHAIGGYLRSVSSQKIWGSSDQFLRLLYMGPPQISFCAYFFFGGAPLRLFFSYYMGPLRSDFLHTI